MLPVKCLGQIPTSRQLQIIQPIESVSALTNIHTLLQSVLTEIPICLFDTWKTEVSSESLVCKNTQTEEPQRLMERNSGCSDL